jgi:hypothetical protein
MQTNLSLMRLITVASLAGSGLLLSQAGFAQESEPRLTNHAENGTTHAATIAVRQAAGVDCNGLRWERCRAIYAQSGLGLIRRGWITFAVTHGLALFVGIAAATADEVNHGWTFMLPFVGPVVAGALNRDHGQGADDGIFGPGPFWAMWVPLALAQIGGFVLLTVGHVKAARFFSTPPAVTVAMTTSHDGTPAVAFSGRF